MVANNANERLLGNNQEEELEADILDDFPPQTDGEIDSLTDVEYRDEVLAAGLSDTSENDVEDDYDDLSEPGTASYGTGIHDQPRFSVHTGSIRDRLQDSNESSPRITGGDIDAKWEQENAVGDEAVGGTAPTPDMDIVDELGAAVGLEMDDRAFLRTSEVLEDRDSRRWELSPESSEDYDNRGE